MNTIKLTEEETATIWAALDSWVTDIRRYPEQHRDNEYDQTSQEVIALAERFGRLPGIKATT